MHGDTVYRSTSSNSLSLSIQKTIHRKWSGGVRILSSDESFSIFCRPFSVFEIVLRQSFLQVEEWHDKIFRSQFWQIKSSCVCLEHFFLPKFNYETIVSEIGRRCIFSINLYLSRCKSGIYDVYLMVTYGLMLQTLSYHYRNILTSLENILVHMSFGVEKKYCTIKGCN